MRLVVVFGIVLVGYVLTGPLDVVSLAGRSCYKEVIKLDCIKFKLGIGDSLPLPGLEQGEYCLRELPEWLDKE